MTVKLLGILNITEDSFSDGGRYLDPAAALARGEYLANNGADIIDLGAASSNPDGKPVPADIEIARLGPVVAALRAKGIPISVDTFSPEVQLWALEQDVDYLNDVQGFRHPEIYERLAAAEANLIVMHAVQEGGRAERIAVSPAEILDRVLTFFGRRLPLLEAAGIARERLILDPGMGFFLGTDPEASYKVLRHLETLRRAFSLPVLVSVSRKSFLRKITGKGPQEAGAATLAAELFAAAKGADYIRTHEPGALKDGLLVQRALGGNRLWGDEPAL
ncbi:MAG TPA: dihydropteroate synthase [Rhizomicrobium sp.]|nr:dihydropteroate synthase [Rhizomicrobium sp.]